MCSFNSLLRPPRLLCVVMLTHHDRLLQLPLVIGIYHSNRKVTDRESVLVLTACAAPLERGKILQEAAIRAGDGHRQVPHNLPPIFWSPKTPLLSCASPGISPGRDMC